MRSTIGVVLAIAFLALGAGSAVADEASEASEKTRQVLAYGIDTQVLEVISRLQAARDEAYTAELTTLLAESRSSDVRVAILGLFSDLGVRNGEPVARTIVSAWETGPVALTSAGVAYLSFIHADGLAALLLPVADSSDAALASAAIRAIGLSRDPSALEPLLAKLASVEFPDTRKGDVVVALGELRDMRAVDALIRIAKGGDEDKTRRLYAADALGKIGDRRALPVLKALFDEDDALLRAYAASALAAFGMEEALPSLLAGLRDGNVKVRTQCVKALARPLDPADAARVVPILTWKADNDPERSVRLESIRALGAIADPASIAFLEALLLNGKAALDHREAALTGLVSRTPGAAGILKAINQEIGAKDQKPAQMMARVLAQAKGDGLAPALVRLLDSQEYTVRIYAIRGLSANGVTSALSRISDLAEKDPVQAVRGEAARAKARLAATPAAPTSSAH